VDASSADPLPELTFDDYEQVRSWVLDSELGTPIVSVERALYELARSIRGKRGRTWRQYADLVAAKVERQARTGPSGLPPTWNPD
jgi:hypothetical protein